MALIAGGCGSDDGDGATEAAGGGLSQEEYVREVREAVAPVATQSEELITQATEARQVEDLAEPLGEAQETYQESTEQLESLEPPAEVEDLHGQLVEVQQDIADAAQSAQRAAREGNRQGLRKFGRTGDRYRRRIEELLREFSERGFEL